MENALRTNPLDVKQLMSVTNAAGHVTTYNEYEPNGKPKKITDARGAVYTMTYHARDWLTSVVKTSGALSETTSYDYWPTGLLKKVTQPDGSFTSYTYDTAQRLVGIADNLNNTVSYTLDNAGNRLKEEVKDPGGALKRNIARTMDTLSRVKSVTGAAQ
jgi:YD repeat-containing protein